MSPEEVTEEFTNEVMLVFASYLYQQDETSTKDSANRFRTWLKSIQEDAWDEGFNDMCIGLTYSDNPYKNLERRSGDWSI